MPRASEWICIRNEKLRDISNFTRISDTQQPARGYREGESSCDGPANGLKHGIRGEFEEISSEFSDCSSTTFPRLCTIPNWWAIRLELFAELIRESITRECNLASRLRNRVRIQRARIYKNESSTHYLFWCNFEARKDIYSMYNNGLHFQLWFTAK